MIIKAQLWYAAPAIQPIVVKDLNRDPYMQGNLFDFGFTARPKLRLSRIEEILRRSRVIEPIPSRPKLIALCEEGILDGHRTDFGWLVTEESFKAWVRTLDPES